MFSVIVHIPFQPNECPNFSVLSATHNSLLPALLEINEVRTTCPPAQGIPFMGIRGISRVQLVSNPWKQKLCAGPRSGCSLSKEIHFFIRLSFAPGGHIHQNWRLLFQMGPIQVWASPRLALKLYDKQREIPKKRVLCTDLCQSKFCRVMSPCSQECLVPFKWAQRFH